ncbi:hypothetical protein GGP62_003369 [Salinibacter ruber]|nr:hypothetical protein [Salinibacter ruber]
MKTISYITIVTLVKINMVIFEVVGHFMTKD